MMLEWGLKMIKFTNEELLIIRAALLNFKKAPFVSDGEKEIIKAIINKLFDTLFQQAKDE